MKTNYFDYPFRLSFLGLLALVWAQSIGAPRASSQEIDFADSIMPILRERCYTCHSEIQQMGGLRLDRRDDALQGGKSGAVIIPGDGAGSKLVQMVAGAVEGAVMPLVGDRLTPEQVDVLRAWIDQGANWTDGVTAESVDARDPRASHWSFQPVRRPPLPEVKNTAWIKNEIDAFVLARLEAESIEPAPEADKRCLIRRLSLDITGLPPTTTEVAAFLADEEPGAYGRLVESLLHSPHYGEKWGRYWQDLVRYADSEGYAGDDDLPHMWR